MSNAALKISPAAADAADPVNRALVLYTGFGRSSFPRARTADLVQEFGEPVAGELKLRILSLYTEMQMPLPDEGKRTRKSLTERAVEQMRLLHPELDEEGLAVLAWAFSFGMR